MLRRVSTSWAGLALVAVAGLSAPRAAHAEWAALGWDHCGSQILSKAFACDSDVGESRIVVSALRDSVAFFTDGFRCVLEVAVDAPSLPAWWQVNPGDCRAGAMTLADSFTPDDASNCLPPNQFGLNLATDYLPTAARLRATIVAFSPSGDSQMTADVESFIVAVLLAHTRAAGPGSCGGCDIPACIMLRELTMIDGFPAFALVTLPIREPTFLLGWQSDRTNCIATPVRNRTWGGLKALYR